MANITFLNTPAELRSAAAMIEHRQSVEAARTLAERTRKARPRRPGTGPKAIDPRTLKAVR